MADENDFLSIQQQVGEAVIKLGGVERAKQLIEMADPEGIDPTGNTAVYSVSHDATYDLNAKRCQQGNVVQSVVEWSKPITKKALQVKLLISRNTLNKRLTEGALSAAGKIRFQAPQNARKIQVAVNDLPADLQTEFRKSLRN